MKSSIQDRINTTEKLVRLCSIISIVAIVVSLLLLAAEFFIVRISGDVEWKRTVLRICIYSLYFMPFAIVVPLFFRVNLKNKLYQLYKKLDEEA